MKLAQKMLELARKEIGVTEINGTNCGPRVNEFKAATWLPATKSWPWCAAFICWLVREAMIAEGVKETKTFKRPRTAGAFDFENWSLSQGNETNTKKPHKNDLLPGDIVVFKFSHVGIVEVAPKDGVVTCIEGNTDGAGSREGGAVLRKKRRVDQIRSRIRVLI